MLKWEEAAPPPPPHKKTPHKQTKANKKTPTFLGVINCFVTVILSVRINNHECLIDKILLSHCINLSGSRCLLEHFYTYLWWHISAITCQIIMLACQIFISSCQIFILTCQIFMLTCVQVSLSKIISMGCKTSHNQLINQSANQLLYLL